MSVSGPVGVLALQGAVELHRSILEGLGCEVRLVRRAEQLDGIERLVLPGGESTTMSMLAERTGLLDPLRRFVCSGAPVLGTCAGAILLSSRIVGGRSDQHCLGAIDVVAHRNGFGTQVDSFTQEITIGALGDVPFPAVCIRAPVIDAVGPGVDVLAEIDGRAAMVVQGPVAATIFHPELSGDARVHEWFLNR